MSLAIEAVVTYTHNLRLGYPTKIKGAFKVTIENDKTYLELPDSTNKIFYTVGSTIYIASYEVVGTVLIGIGDDNYSTMNDFYSAQGLYPILCREFKGSIDNGGFYVIKAVDGNKLELDVEEGDLIEEDFNGVICKTAWRESSAIFKPLAAYYKSDSLGSGVISEKVKNYSYQLSDSKNRVSSLGIPKDLITPFNRFKKLPNSYDLQMKELIYG